MRKRLQNGRLQATNRTLGKIWEPWDSTHSTIPSFHPKVTKRAFLACQHPLQVALLFCTSGYVRSPPSLVTYPSNTQHSLELHRYSSQSYHILYVSACSAFPTVCVHLFVNALEASADCQISTGYTDRWPSTVCIILVITTAY